MQLELPVFMRGRLREQGFVHREADVLLREALPGYRGGIVYDDEGDSLRRGRVQGVDLQNECLSFCHGYGE